MDLSCQNLDALRNTELFKAYSRLHPAVWQLVVLVKCWARAANVCGAPDGYLSSYSWTLMVIYFLQVHPELQMPCLDTEPFRQGATVESGEMPTWNCSRPPHWLLEAFFMFYAGSRDGFRWGTEALSPRNVALVW